LLKLRERPILSPFSTGGWGDRWGRNARLRFKLTLEDAASLLTDALGGAAAAWLLAAASPGIELGRCSIASSSPPGGGGGMFMSNQSVSVLPTGNSHDGLVYLYIVSA
jgi:hypothetical protein